MSIAPTPAVFQAAAVNHILERLRDRRGSQRFLLADEVGLGKTIVARGVIDALAKGRRSPLRVVYLCSNSEIAEQNRHKLASVVGSPIRRVTELAFKTNESSGDVHLYAFTPGTSMSGGTGAAWERRLMLYLLGRIWREDVTTKKWRTFFRCAVTEERWLGQTRWSDLESEFGRNIRTDFRDALVACVRTEYGSAGGPASLADEVAYYDERRLDDRKRRNEEIGRLRGILQRAAIQSLNADLVVLDEVQRFRDVLKDADDGSSIAASLLGRKAPVLILSATPYRLLTLSHEEEGNVGGHHEEFHETVEFLFGKDRKTPAQIKENLAEFGRQLRTSDLTAVRDNQLLTLKRRVEADLKQVICRTERNWYMLDQRHGIMEQGTRETALPRRPEMREFFEIHRGLEGHLDGVGLVSEFWKSAPSLLTYMDSEYALVRKLREGKVRVPRGLLSSPADSTLPSRNLRLRRVIDHALGGSAVPPRLWTVPTYTYYRDTTRGEEAPRKMLVFSGWRFVPKAVAVAVSQAAAQRLPYDKKKERQPLRFGDKPSFHVFDVCFPSLALASVADPRVGATSEREAGDWSTEVRTALTAALSSAKVSIQGKRGAPLWQIVARLEAKGPRAQAIRVALGRWSAHSDGGSTSTYEHRQKMLDWMRDSSASLAIGTVDFNRLVRIAAFSPAVSLVRSLRSVYGEDDLLASMPSVMNLCMNQLRGYWNRPLNQQAVRSAHAAARGRKRSKREVGFAEQVLAYARDHHLQAVLDEHGYLLRNAASASNVERAVKHFQSVWSLGRGSRRVNEPHGQGQTVRIAHDKGVWPTHFALAFGEESVESKGVGGDAEERLRRSDVREAFNSPFWPFVLATTSVGQEGLDFHLYCRDVFHWNLPSNPVDLEQREGRINRRDCLAVRQSIAKDWPLERIREGLREANSNPWTGVFDRLGRDHSTQRYKHGLYPHWLYECRDPAQTVRIARHVAFYASSRDVKAYARLKSRLALYRLVFGQANQEHLLEGLESRLAEIGEAERDIALKRLSGYMLNMSPFSAAAAKRLANEEAGELLEGAGTAGLERLLADVEELAGGLAADLEHIRADVAELAARVRQGMETGRLRSRELRKAVFALAYLRNPYDQYFDGGGLGGLDDDIAVLRGALVRGRG